MKKNEILHNLRNPWGKSEDTMRITRLAAADLIEKNDTDKFKKFDFDVVELIFQAADRHGIDRENVRLLLDSLDEAARAIHADPMAFYTILLDSISSGGVMTVNQIKHQLMVALENNGLGKTLNFGIKNW